MNVGFYGVRGSTPCCSADSHRYGGNTSCVVLTDAGREPLVLDLGTGLRFYGQACENGQFEGTALVSHLHWDHVQGLPFFGPGLAGGSKMTVYAPASEDYPTARAAFDAFMNPPFFPVGLDALAGEFDIRDAPVGAFESGGWTVRCGEVPHVGRTLGFRVSNGEYSLAYIPDHQQPGPNATDIDPSVRELCADVDVLIHDAQFDDEEFAKKPDWGHCTWRYAVHVACEVGAKCLVLFHHDPSHNDERVDGLLAAARDEAARRGGPEVLAAAERMFISLAAGGRTTTASADKVVTSNGPTEVACDLSAMDNGVQAVVPLAPAAP